MTTHLTDSIVVHRLATRAPSKFYNALQVHEIPY